MKTLSENQVRFLKSKLEKDPGSLEATLSGLQAKGYDTSPLESMDWGAEIKAFAKGVPEGHLVVTDFGPTKGASTVDLPVVGEVQPARELGRVAGALIPSPVNVGSKLLFLGKALGNRMTPELTKRLMAAGMPAKLAEKAIGPAANLGIRQAPFSVVGAGAQTVHEDGDWEDFARKSMEWMALGVLTDVAQAGLSKGFRALQKKRAGQPVTPTEVRAIDELQTLRTEAGDLREPPPKWVNEDGPPLKQSMVAGREFAEAPLSTSVTGPLFKSAEEAATATAAADRLRTEGRDLAALRVEIEVKRPVLPEHFDVQGGKTTWQEGQTTTPIGEGLNKGEILGTTPTENIPAPVLPPPNARFFLQLQGLGKQGISPQYVEAATKSLDDLYAGKLAPEQSLEQAATQTRELMAASPAFGEHSWAQASAEFSQAHELLYRAVSQQKLTPEEAKGLLQLALSQGADIGKFRGALEKFGREVEMKPPGEAVVVSLPEPKKPRGPQSGDQVTLQAGEETLEGVLVESDVRGQWALRVGDEPGVRYVPKKGSKAKVVRPSVGGGTDIPGENVPAAPEQLAEISRLMGEYQGQGGKLEPSILPRELTVSQARGVLRNLQDGLAARQILAVDEAAAQIVERAKGSKGGPPEKIPPIWEAVEEGADLRRDVGVLWQVARVGSPWSRHVFGADPQLKMELRATQNKKEEVQGIYAGWMEKYNQVRKLVGLPEFSLTGAVKSLPQQMVRKLQGQPDPVEEGYKRLYALARALDFEGPVPDEIARQPQMMQAYTLYRQLMKEVADALGLPAGRRIGHYLAHVFAGQTGRWRARVVGEEGRIGEELQAALEGKQGAGNLPGEAAALIEGQQPTPEIKDKFFGHLLKRSANLQGFDYDLDRISYAYLKGASEKVFADWLVPRSREIIEAMPAMQGGKPLHLKQEYAQYIRHILGAPTAAREKIAHWFGNKQAFVPELFNKSIDNLVEVIGGAEEKGLLTRARLAGEGDPQAIAGAATFLRSLEEQLRTRDAWTGEKLARTSADKQQALYARTALWLNDLRISLQDPNMAAPVANQIYRVQILAKLGFNFVHGLVNLSQTPINTYALLGERFTASGVYHTINNNTRLHGRAVKELLDESGIPLDLAKVEEFVNRSGPGTAFRVFQDIAMKPSVWSEQFNRRTAFLGAYDRARTQGMDHLQAMGEARNLVEKTQFSFSRLGTPALLRSPGLRLLFMFKSFPIHQTNFSIELIEDALKGEIAPLARHAMAYLAMGGILGWGVLGNTNLAQRTSPPAGEMLTDIYQQTQDKGGWSLPGNVVKAMTGPIINVLGDLMQGQGAQAVESLFVPSLFTRWQKDGWDGSWDGAIRLLGARKRPEKRGRRSLQLQSMPSLR